MNDSSKRRPPPPVPVAILTGFLGAGKTTFLNKLLQDPSLANTLVLINEFGEIGLDHLFVEAIDRDMMLMASGCLCCTIRGELVDTLESVLRRLDNGRIKPFNRVLIETTGLADPAPVMHTIMQHPYLSMRFYPESLITVVDAVNGNSTLDHHPEAVKQAAMADALVVSKSDMLAAAARSNDLALLRARLEALNPAARMFDATQDKPAPADLFTSGVYDPAARSPDVAAWLRAEAIAAHRQAGERQHARGNAHDHKAHDHTGHDHTGHDHTGHKHDPNRHDDRIRAVCLRARAPLLPANFEYFIEMLRKVHGEHLLRLKGIVCLSDDPDRPVIVHGVQHVFHPPVRLDRWPDRDRSTRLVCILRDLAPDHVEGLWNAFLGNPAPDRPDARALVDNPLKPAGSGLLG